jgi:hypothetical protein
MVLKEAFDDMVLVLGPTDTRPQASTGGAQWQENSNRDHFGRPAHETLLAYEHHHHIERERSTAHGKHALYDRDYAAWFHGDAAGRQVQAFLATSAVFKDSIVASMKANIKITVRCRLCLEGFIKHDPLDLLHLARKLEIQIEDDDCKTLECARDGYRTPVLWGPTCRRVATNFKALRVLSIDYHYNDDFDFDRKYPGRFKELQPLSGLRSRNENMQIKFSLLTVRYERQKDSNEPFATKHHQFERAMERFLEGKDKEFRMEDGSGMYDETKYSD